MAFTDFTPSFLTVLTVNIPPPNSLIPTPPVRFSPKVSVFSALAQPFITKKGQETNPIVFTNDLIWNIGISRKMDTSENNSIEIKLLL